MTNAPHTRVAAATTDAEIVALDAGAGVLRWLAADPGSSLTTNQMISPIRAIQNKPMKIHMNGGKPRFTYRDDTDWTGPR